VEDNGMGVKIREKIPGSGAWWVFVNHKRRRKALKIGAQKAANKVAEQITARLKLGQPITDDKPALPTVEEYWKRFKDTYLQTAVAESTASSYETNFTVHIVPFLGKLHLDEITPAKMEEFIADLVANKKRAKATIAVILRELSRLFTHAMKHKLLSENPASNLGDLYSQAPTRHEKIEPLIPEEVPLFLEAARAPMPSETRKVRATRNGETVLETVAGRRDWSLERYTLFLCAIHTGLRAGEQLALEWGDVDWRSKFASVERSYDRVHRKVVPTKTKKIRRVDLSDELLEALQSLRTDRLEAWFAREKTPLVTAGLWDDVAKLPKVIFCNEDGGYMDRANLAERHFLRCLQAAGLKRRRYHDLRHTFASLLLTAGAPIAYVSEQMGHSSIEMTVKRYGHLEPGANRKFINNLPGAKTATSVQLAEEA
jgi:integrase